MMNVVTSVCVDSLNEDSKVGYPMLKKNANKREVYWRCALTFFLTSVKVNPGKKHIVFTNDKDEVIINNYDIRKKLFEIGVDIRELAFINYNPGHHSKKFKNAFYKHEVINALADLKEPSILLDSDCIWTKSDDILFQILEKGEYLLLQDTYQRSSNPKEKSPHNLSMEDMGKLYKTIPLLKSQSDHPVWYGGELIAGSPGHFKLIAKNIYKLLEYCKEQAGLGNKIEFSNGNSIFDNDEYISSYVYNSLSDIKIFDTHGVFSKRMWVLPDINNVRKEDINLAIWHLPSEKETGLKELFNEIIKTSSVFWQDNVCVPDFLGDFVGITNPRRRQRGIKLLLTRCKNALKHILR